MPGFFHRAAVSAVAVFAFAGLATPALAQAPNCAGLLTLRLPDTRITTAEEIPGGTRWAFPPSPFNLFVGLNANTDRRFCRVVGVIEREIRFEVWLPPEWNDRFLGVGNGGYTGAINYPSLGLGLARGFATASTDTGHQTPTGFFDASWVAGHPDRVENFGHRAHHLLAGRAKQIVRAFYGRPANFAYYDGCSSGGWQGMTEAQRYPADYDGIVAGAPANNFVRLQTRAFWLDSLARANPAGNLGRGEIALISSAAMAQCDPADGVRDGIMSDPQGCGFDPGSLLCRPGQTGSCLTQAQVERARLVYGPRRTARGLALYPGNAWGVPPIATLPGVSLDEPMLMQAMPAAERRWTALTFDSDRDIPSLEARYGASLGAWNPDLRPFAARGGKLIVYHGWADGLLSPWNSIAYWEAANGRMGARNVSGFYRLFMAPGMDHCRGGPGPDRFDALEAVMAWRERGQAPERLIASGGSAPGGPRTRPLCPHPQVARYSGTGSVNDAASFRCVAPRR
jgi:feruloyl esterase